MGTSCKATVLVLSFLVQRVAAGDFYVGLDGKSTNAGTVQSPWDIASAFDGRQKVAPGDTIYLLEGVYRRRPKELFEIRLVGTADKPIYIRPAPGARARIDGGLSMQSPSEHVWVRGLEVFVSEPAPAEPVSPGSAPKDLNRPWGGVYMYAGKSCKYINLIIHHCNQGISCWKGEIDPEIYGCIIYGNGWLGMDRGHGHCIYTQNDEGVKRISNCIMSCRYDGTYTMHAYGSSRAYVNNYLVEENICYGKGPFLIGGGRPSRNIRVFRNYLYNVDMRIGYNAPHNDSCEIRDNVIINGSLNVVKYKRAVQQDNLVLARGGEHGDGVTSMLLPNRFDPNRAHLAVYSRDKADTAEVAVGAFLKAGDRFRLMDPQDLFGRAVAEGRCEGQMIRVPVKSGFGVFVVLRGERR